MTKVTNYQSIISSHQRQDTVNLIKLPAAFSTAGLRLKSSRIKKAALKECKQKKGSRESAV